MSRKNKMIRKAIVAIVAFTIAVGLFPINALAAVEPVSGTATVGDSNVNVRSGPGTNYDKLDKAMSGEVFNVTGIDEEAGWVEIDFNGQTGYLSLDYVSFEVSEDEIIEVEVIEDDEDEDEDDDKKADDDEEIPEVGEESPMNYKLIFGLIGAIVVLFLVILLTIKSLKDSDYDDDDDYEYDDDYYGDDEYYEEEYEEEYEDNYARGYSPKYVNQKNYYEPEYDFTPDEEDDDEYEYEYVTVRRPKQQARTSKQARPQQRRQYYEEPQPRRKSSNDDYLVDIDPRYFE